MTNENGYLIPDRIDRPKVMMHLDIDINRAIVIDKKDLIILRNARNKRYSYYESV